MRADAMADRAPLLPLGGRLVALDALDHGEASPPWEQAVLSIANYTAEMLQAQGASVLVTTGTPSAASAAGRARQIEQHGAEVLIFLRTGSHPSTQIRGVRALVPSPYALASRRLAERLLKRIGARTGLPSRGVPLWSWFPPDLAAVIRGHRPVSLVVEVATPTCPADELLLMRRGFQLRVAHGLTEGLLDYFGQLSAGHAPAGLVEADPAWADSAPDTAAGEGLVPDGTFIVSPVPEGLFHRADVAEGGVAQGDTPEDDVSEGNVAEGDTSGDEVSEGNVAIGDIPEDGVPEGNVAAGDTPEDGVFEGNVAAGDLPEDGVSGRNAAGRDAPKDDGDVAEGATPTVEVAEANVSTGDTPEGDVLQGNVIRDDAPEGYAPGGNVAGEDISGNNISGGYVARGGRPEDGMAGGLVSRGGRSEDGMAGGYVARGGSPGGGAAEGNAVAGDIPSDDVPGVPERHIHDGGAVEELTPAGDGFAPAAPGDGQRQPALPASGAPGAAAAGEPVLEELVFRAPAAEGLRSGMPTAGSDRSGQGAAPVAGGDGAPPQTASDGSQASARARSASQPDLGITEFLIITEASPPQPQPAARPASAGRAASPSPSPGSPQRPRPTWAKSILATWPKDPNQPVPRTVTPAWVQPTAPIPVQPLQGQLPPLGSGQEQRPPWAGWPGAQGAQPFTGQVPHGGQMPQGGQVPHAGQVPHGGSTPQGVQVPHAGQVPQTGQLPPARQVPPAGGVPPGAQMAWPAQVPPGGDVPASATTTSPVYIPVGGQVTFLGSPGQPEPMVVWPDGSLVSPRAQILMRLKTRSTADRAKKGAEGPPES